MATQRRQGRPVVWLIVAAVLLGIGAWLMRGAEPPEKIHQPPVKMPTRMTMAERTRGEERRTWLPQVSDAGIVAEPQRPRDPVLAMMPAEVKRGAVVAEFNAIMNSELGPKLNECFFGDGEGNSLLSRLRDAGLDPTQKVDRVAMIDDSLVVSGDFKNSQWKQFVPGASTSRDYGRNGQLHDVSFGDGGTQNFATWNGQMFITGGNEEELKAILDRLDGSGPQVNPVIDESMAYGDVYGVFPAGPLAELMGESDPKLAALIEQSAKSMQVHMDVGHDVGLVADVESNNASSTDELRRALGAALSLARMKATAKGQDDDATILEMARVRAAEGSGFRLEAGVPNAVMVDFLDRCIEKRRQRGPRFK